MRQCSRQLPSRPPNSFSCGLPFRRFQDDPKPENLSTVLRVRTQPAGEVSQLLCVSDSYQELPMTGVGRKRASALSELRLRPQTVHVVDVAEGERRATTHVANAETSTGSCTAL